MGPGLELELRLNQQSLRQDLAGAQALLRSSLGNQEIKIGVSTNTQVLRQLETDLAGATAKLGADSRLGPGLERQAKAYQESARYAGELEKINDAIAKQQLIGDDDIARARSLAAEINKINLRQIDGDQFARGLTALGTAAGALAVPLNAAVGASSKANLEFDAARGKVATLSNDSAAYADVMRGLSKDLKGQAGSVELLNAGYEVLSSGFASIGENSQVLKASVLGAKGGFSDTKTVADALTTTLNAFQLKASDSSRVIDILAQTQNAGKITIGQYAEGIGRVASVANLSGVKLEELSAAIATSTAKGVPAQTAISGVRQAIINLLKPTDDAQALLKKFGVENSTAALKSEGLIGILKRLQEGGASSDELSKIFSDVDALATVSTLAGANLQDFGKNLELMGSSAGTAQKAADAVAATLSGRLTAATNTANEIMIGLGAGINLALGPVLDLVTSAGQAFLNLPAPIQAAGGAVVAAAAGFTALTAAVALNNALGLQGQVVLAATTAKQLVSTAVTTAQAGAQTLLAVATGKATAAQSAQILGLAKGAVTMALVAGAALAVAEVFKRSEGAQFASTIRDGLKDLQPELAKAKESASDLDARLGRVGQSFAKGGAVEAVRAGLVELQAQFLRGATAADEFGNGFGFVTAQQRGAQLAQLALADFVEATNKSFDAGTALVAKYGLSQLEVGDRARLGAKGIAEFKSAAGEQLKSLDANISKLRELEGAAKSDGQRAQISAQIKLLEQQKGAIAKRIEFLNADGEAAAKNAAAQKPIAKSLEELNAAYDKNLAKLDLRSKNKQADLVENVAASANPAEAEKAQQTALVAAEQAGFAERIALAKSKAAELRKTLAGTSDSKERDNIEAELLKAESGIADTRIAKARSVAAAKKVAAEEAEAAQKKAADAEIAKLEAANTAAEAALNQAQARRVRAAQAQGEGRGDSQEKIAAEVAQIEAEGQRNRAGQVQAEIAQVKRLGAAKTLDAAETQKRLLALNAELAQANLAAADKELEAQRQLRAAKLAAADAQASQRRSKVDAQESGAILAARQEQVLRGRSEEQAQAAIAQIQSKATTDRLNLASREVTETQQLRKAGILTEAEAQERLKKLGQERTQLATQQVERQIAAQQRLREAALKAQEGTATQRRDTVDLNEREAVTAAKKRGVEVGRSEQQTQAEIAAIQRKAIADRIALVAQEVSEVEALKRRGLLTDEQAGQKLGALRRSQADLAGQQADQEVAYRQRVRDAAIKLLDDQAAKQRTTSEQAQGLLALELQGLQEQGALLSARAGLQSALNSLANSRLQTEIAAADASGDTAKAEQLRANLTAQQEAQAQAAYSVKLQELGLQEQQAELQREQQRLQAEIAKSEAEIALAKAKAAGASGAEIDNLQKILSLREKQVGAIAQSAAADDQRFALQRQQLAAEEATRQEGAKQSRIQAAVAAKESSAQPPVAGPSSPKLDAASLAQALQQPVALDGRGLLQAVKAVTPALGSGASGGPQLRPASPIQSQAQAAVDANRAVVEGQSPAQRLGAEGVEARLDRLIEAVQAAGSGTRIETLNYQGSGKGPSELFEILDQQSRRSRYSGD